MLNITIYCFKKKSEINVCFLLNTYSFSTLKFNSLSALYFILYDLFSAWRFVATDAMIVKFQNVINNVFDKRNVTQLSRSTDIRIM